MKIGIVGGSIAGCTAAILLRKEGHRVSIFERSGTTLVGRGGGIGTLPELLDQLIREGILSENFPFFSIGNMPFVGKNNRYEPYGRTAWAMPMNLCVFHWQTLWNDLRSKVPDEIYHAGVEVIHAVPTSDDKVFVTSSNGRKEKFDLILFADGYNSFGRKLLFPDVSLKYRDYILWRGLLPESDMPAEGILKNTLPRLSYAESPGHMVIYYIPSHQGSVRKGDRIFNWAAYIPVQTEALEDLMKDPSGTLWRGTLPPGKMRKEKENELKDFLARNIPSYYAELVNKTQNSYVQVIYTLDLQSYYRDKMCLIGDAGMVIQPFTGSGVFKGYHNVADLITHLKEEKSFHKALEQWSDHQIQKGKILLELGEQMEKAFIWNQLDFSSVDEKTTETWWKSSIRFPENFNLQK
jgi:2-polyprenyl-6-methoxyphenol hydroxylase-like FAD-dependent oxidoreductase